ncbi:asparagine synthase (glutamine-hydrolyzing) [Sphingomonas sp. JC676]|uniref:asparagine synthase (glutamine-hydrolyzing) n=1 Tax=Sphingomonas sp. JC676 TaxID=2768065 RepID=UPI00165808E3|nr:asparagine synthase (glutamine-hydrolyzing) [Sphingomonas sp. JC676]MBC9030955.1 asparagine synthase (glutamine-hydrolyzing) [Sphingomonas sp. JC676]
MCGIAGFVASGSLDASAEASLAAMTQAIGHRGPDDAGAWLDRERGVALGHRRLAIIDLSPAGHQPMKSASGRYVIVYNGEIYNHTALRAQLEREGHAPDWIGRSDTEVLLACIEAWGLRGALAEANGMFAFALWDLRERELILARDRAGEKPLYYGRQGNAILFASELKAITAHPAFEAVVDRAAAAQFMQLGYVPAPLSIWKGINKLPPAHLLVIRPGDKTLAAPECYWDFARIAAAGAMDPTEDTPDLVDELDALLRDAVRLRMEADVPLGVFLSGGIDSSVITALMQAQASRPVKTFSIGFEERSFDESGFASGVAKHLGTDHHALRVTPAEVQAVLPELPRIWDEPFADSSQVPTYLVNARARKEVTVALSGDGGDELFAGYNRHVIGAQIWNKSERLPGVVRRGVGAALAAPVAGRFAHGLSRLTGLGSGVVNLTERLSKVGAVMGADDPADVYARLVSKWPHGGNPIIGGQNERAEIASGSFSDFRNAMLFMDTMTYLPDDILVKVDRAGMAVSLEGRIPFLDHRVIELSWRIPLSAKIKAGRGKHILREVLYRYVPQTLVDRPKAGFAIPIGDWLVGPLRPWVEDLLAPSKIKAQGFLDPLVVAATWSRFRRGESALLPKLWCLLMFQAWLSSSGQHPLRP